MARALSPRGLRRVMNLWPPFLCSGIQVRAISDDWRSAEVQLKMRPWNRNFFGVHFGGSLFAMTDPFWMLLAVHALGRDYIVWDKAAEIEFVKTGKGTVTARFEIDDAMLDTIRAATADGEKYLHWCDTAIVDANGDLVAHVRKQLYIRRKRDSRDST